MFKKYLKCFFFRCTRRTQQHHDATQQQLWNAIEGALSRQRCSVIRSSDPRSTPGWRDRSDSFGLKQHSFDPTTSPAGCTSTGASRSIPGSSKTSLSVKWGTHCCSTTTARGTTTTSSTGSPSSTSSNSSAPSCRTKLSSLNPFIIFLDFNFLCFMMNTGFYIPHEHLPLFFF